MTSNGFPRIAFIGFGEAGQAMAEGLRSEGAAAIAAWDILFPATAGARLQQAANRIGVRIANSAADAVADAGLVIAAVTAASSGEAAQSVAPHLRARPFYLDVNSVSPGRKQQSAALLADKARYLDVAILSPILPLRHKAPLLISGPYAKDAAATLSALGMSFRILGPRIGEAAALKMVRSVMIKGIEALTAECFLAAARAGIVDAVAQSLENNYPAIDWPRVVQYNIERMASHGIRRAAEMEEVAATLRELGVAPLMTEATVRRQRELGEIGGAPQVRAALDQGAAAMLAAIERATAASGS